MVFDKGISLKEYIQQIINDIEKDNKYFESMELEINCDVVNKEVLVTRYESYNKIKLTITRKDSEGGQ